MEIKINRPEPVETPPPTYTLTLTEREFLYIALLVGTSGVNAVLAGKSNKPVGLTGKRLVERLGCKGDDLAYMGDKLWAAAENAIEETK